MTSPPEPVIGEEAVRKAVGLALDGYYEERPLAETTEWSLDIWERTDRVARAAISAHLEALERAGWVVVPRGPPKAMLEAGCTVPLESREMRRASVAGTLASVKREKMKIRWRAMIGAA